MSRNRRWDRRALRLPDDPSDVLGALNELNQHLRRGLDERSAAFIARTTRQLLDCRVVAVTADSTLLAQDGEAVDWQVEVEDHATLVLERRRTAKPTLYTMSLGRDQAEVAVAVLTSDDVPIGTIHAMTVQGQPLNMNALRELTVLVGSQLQIAELDQSRAFAAEAELRALRAQLSPHFLHNSLTAIAGLVNTDPIRARSAISQFSDFLRASFRIQSDLWTLSEELRLVDLYLELARVRFGDRFDVLLTIDPETLPVQVPVLSVQTLVENALRHGLETKPGQGSLHLGAENDGPEITITVEDDGVGIDPDRLQQALNGTDTSSHVGILATDTRLRSTFGPEYGLMIATAANAGTKVIMRLPKNPPKRG